ncbi:uncharacterized protein LOC125845293 [Solanum stenotomum]|uniref:uncharacterized protein LOC125845293 n=1 Tax=Solanum stenotomum TaxID=172797 RepID=UPI0020D03B63|nr:uncharacterized protein LOC125845293 [Solanum stenotomum]
MPSRRSVRGPPARRNVEEQGVTNAPEVQPQGEVMNTEFREAIRMLSQWKKGRAEGAPPVSWACFEEAFLGRFFSRELREAKMVVDMRNWISLFVAGLSHLSSKEGKAAMLIRDMDIARLMVYVQQVEEEKLRDREEFRNKKAKTSGNESEQQRNNVNQCTSK